MERPTFLTVLCILTFVGASMFFFGGIQFYSNADVMPDQFAEAFDQLEDQLGASQDAEVTQEAFEKAEKSLTSDNLRNLGLTLIIGNLLAIIGAVLMWGLKKTGFYVYIVGALVACAGPIFVFGWELGSGFLFLFGFFSIIFSVLFGTNLKYLR